MSEPIATIGTAAIVAYLSKNGIEKLLGPTADYLGGEIKLLVEKGQRNVHSVFKRAERKCGDKLRMSGVVNPRVFKHIYDEARFCEDELLAEYFGGVLASSRTDSSQDDRGVYYTQIVKSLSTYQLRCHYLFYYLIWQLAKGLQIDLNGFEGRRSLAIIVPAEIYAQTFSVVDRQKEMSLIAHSLAGLNKADLIEDSFEFSSQQVLAARGVNVDQQSFLISPTITGLELFLWAHGNGDRGLNAFLDPLLVTTPDLEIKLSHLAKLKNR